MGVRKDLKRAKRRTDLAARTRVEVVRDGAGVVREARTPALAPRITSGSTADLP
jgi:long-chain acyl-CoA synthetase